MTTAVILDQQRNDATWGLCPVCKRNDGYLNVGRAQWVICHRHRVKWLLGDGVFSSWRDDPPEVHEKNGDLLACYGEVSPVFRKAVCGPQRRRD